MSLEQTRNTIEKRIWQTIASSGVNISGIPRADLDKLVKTLTINMLQEFNDLLGVASPIPEVGGAAGAPGKIGAATKAANVEVPTDEELLWEGRPFLSLVERYAITNERVRIVSGLIGREHEDIELVRVKDIDWKQGMGERMLGIGDIIINTADTTSPLAVLQNVQHPEVVHEILRRAVVEIRKKYHIIFEQEM